MSYIDVLILIGRVLFGGFFLQSAYSHFKNVDMMTGYAQSKGIASPRFAVQGTGLLLLIGGLGYVLGNHVPYSAAALVIFLLGVSFKMHDYWAIQDPQMKGMQRVQFMKNMALLGAVLMSLAIPLPWMYSWGM